MQATIFYVKDQLSSIGRIFEWLDQCLNQYRIKGHLETKLTFPPPHPLEFPGFLIPLPIWIPIQFLSWWGNDYFLEPRNTYKLSGTLQLILTCQR